MARKREHALERSEARPAEFQVDSIDGRTAVAADRPGQAPRQLLGRRDPSSRGMKRHAIQHKMIAVAEGLR